MIWRVYISDADSTLYDSDVEAERPQVALVKATAELLELPAVIGKLYIEVNPVARRS